MRKNQIMDVNFTCNNYSHASFELCGVPPRKRFETPALGDKPVPDLLLGLPELDHTSSRKNQFRHFYLLFDRCSHVFLGYAWRCPVCDWKRPRACHALSRKIELSMRQAKASQ